MSNRKGRKEIEDETRMLVKMHQLSKRRMREQPNLKHCGGNLTLMEDLAAIVREKDSKVTPSEYEVEFQKKLKDRWADRIIVKHGIDEFNLLAHEIGYKLFALGSYHMFQDVRANSETYGWYFDRNPSDPEARVIEPITQ